MVNSVLNRVDKFGEGVYKYNSRGFVIQNAREEKFQYSTRGFLVLINNTLSIIVLIYCKSNLKFQVN